MTELAGQIDVGFLSAKAIFGGAGGTVMTFLICLALTSSLSSLIMGGPRVTQAMSRDRQFFTALSRTNRRGAPAAAIILQSSVALFLVLTSTFDAVLTYVGFNRPCFLPWWSWVSCCCASKTPAGPGLSRPGVSPDPGDFPGALRLDDLFPVYPETAAVVLRAPDGGLGTAVL